ncbi:MAG: protein-L-isoaspartate(D-aspartate) O-methyltransferase [Gemmatimonadaceae bacterium]|nr:protein-L-isoaspartate(D-aspartate) O-methyltransferase [Gemmatimonadaceae bacterium]MCW5825113.1 protein-L-isoaspartate(D-aspartate) O-methyltransferase [Gemmatimonadaceae bacterium]
MVAAALTPQFGGARRRLIEELQRKGIRSLSVLKAFDDVPRHEFVPSGLRHRAYEDAPLPIGHGQTISQPWVHAKYLELLELTGDERVLEIGTGSGFQTALLTRLARHVFTVERLAPLAEAAREALRRCGIDHVIQRVGDGTLGWPEYGPYDAILVGAASPDVPEPLLEQLAPGGQLLIPVGDRDTQQLLRIRRTPEGFVTHRLDAMRFVPLIGEHGFAT